MAKGVKTGGRTKGTANKSTKLIRDKFEDVLTSIDAESIINDLGNLEPLDRLKMIISISEYIAPKYQRVTINDDGGGVNYEVPLFPDVNNDEEEKKNTPIIEFIKS